MKFILGIIIITVIITISVFLRFYQIENIPSGLNIDESSEGYNAFSLLNTGKDRYGQGLPILFRSFGSFQAPLYTYFTILPIYFYGNTIFSVRLVSVLSGIILVVVTFFLLINFGARKKIILAVISALTVAVSPWSVFFSRIGTEASLGVAFFALSILFFYFSLKQRWFFPLATLILGLSTHAYYSERLLSPFFLIGFVYLFRKVLIPQKRLLIIGIIIFISTQIPHIFIANSGAFTRRISQVDYFSNSFFQNNGGILNYFPFGKYIFIIREFLSHYLTYFSPRNLFFDSDPQHERSIPDLSVFYNWMLIPLLLGFVRIFKNRSKPITKIIILTIVIAPIPAALTRDPFYTIRTLVLLWTLTITIAFGIDNVLNKLSNSLLRYSLVLFLLIYSGILLYTSYFILLKYEREVFDYSYVKLLEKIRNSPDERFIIDSSRQLANGIRFAFFEKYEPSKLQKALESQVSGQYYSNFEFDEPYILDNIEARPINWKKDLCKRQILIGDLLAISGNQVEEHHLKWLFNINDMAGDVALKAYLTNPDANCKS